MAKFAVLGLRGENGYWLVDFNQGTVTALPELDSAPFGYTDEARANGAVLTAGIDLGVQVVTAGDTFSGQFDISEAFSGQFDS
ncbi:hypothetical protein GGD81_004606 [Rhodobium orientis]|uniref:Uncharacterized protein n=1 Tax=Rhodobium orientis TaxID=34017 RepID=A0A327JEF9_9HYPH|nr:hypothetical protein [Rhodobium orientis]MBB4305526.1 hypothetical protein [Rhodobium orientis]MBK5949123.1 hypothetical protein [Rhodobium orientis]RAI23097.1 hypothetical protein CH339_23305 [Rhodobium orientis]